MRIIDADGVIHEEKAGIIPKSLGSISGLTITPTGLIVGEDATFEQLTGCIRVLLEANKVTPWALGDAVNALKGKWGERYARWAEETGLSWKRLANLAWTCSVFEISRRREKLTFKHHELVAGMEAEERERWLDEAEKLNLSASQLDALIKASKLPPPEEEEPQPDRPLIKKYAPDLGLEPAFEWHELDEMEVRVIVTKTTGAVYLEGPDRTLYCIAICR